MTDHTHDTERAPAADETPTDPGGHAEVPGSSPPPALSDAALSDLLMRLASGLEVLRRDWTRTSREVAITLTALAEQGDRIEGMLRGLSATLEMAIHEERRHGSELARLRADVSGLACRGGDGRVPDDCEAAQ